MNYIVITTATDDLREAKKIANILVDEKLVACAKVYSTESVYTWKDIKENTEEYKIEVKTKKELFDAVSDKIRDLSHYEMPELVSFDITDISSDYAKWIDDNTDVAKFQM